MKHNYDLWSSAYASISAIRTIQKKDSVYCQDGPSRWAKQNSVIAYIRSQVIDRYNQLERAGIEDYFRRTQ